MQYTLVFRLLKANLIIKQVNSNYHLRCVLTRCNNESLPSINRFYILYSCFIIFFVEPTREIYRITLVLDRPFGLVPHLIRVICRSF